MNDEQIRKTAKQLDEFTEALGELIEMAENKEGPYSPQACQDWYNSLSTWEKIKVYFDAFSLIDWPKTIKHWLRGE